MFNYKKKSSYWRKTTLLISGFTTVELLISIAIMSVLFSIGTVNYRNFERKKRLNQAKIQVTTALRHAQELAASGKRPSDPSTPCVKFNGVRFSIKSNQYFYEAICGDAAPYTYEDYVPNQSMPSGVRISTTGIDNLKFLPVGGGVHIPSSNLNQFPPPAGLSSKEIILEYRGLPVETIRIYSNGRIE